MSVSPRRLRGRVTVLTDRLSERAELDRLVDAVRGGEGGVLGGHGDPGGGKTMLLDPLAGRGVGGAGGRPRGAGSGRGNWRSGGCISWARRCWVARSPCRNRSAMRCRP